MATDFQKDCAQSGDFRLEKIARLYIRYEKKLWEAGALDFDDIILHTVRLLHGTGIHLAQEAVVPQDDRNLWPALLS